MVFTWLPAISFRRCKSGASCLGCYNAIWELAATLLNEGVNPDRLSHEELAADLTNSLIPGVVSTPGNDAIIGKLEEADFVIQVWIGGPVLAREVQRHVGLKASFEMNVELGLWQCGDQAGCCRHIAAVAYHDHRYRRGLI